MNEIFLGYYNSYNVINEGGIPKVELFGLEELNTDNVFVRSGECGEGKRYCLSGCFYFVES